MIQRLLHASGALLDHLRPAGEAASSWASNALVGWALQWLAGASQ